MPKELEYMNFEQIAELVLGAQKLNRTGIIGTLAFALFYEYAKNPNTPQLASEFKSIKQNLSNVRKFIDQPEQLEYLDKLNKLMEQFEQAAQNKYDPKSIDFMARVKTILQARYTKEPSNRYAIANINPADAEQHMMLMLSRLNLIKDERIKYNVLGFFYSNPNAQLSESARQAFIMRANSVHATAQDLYYLMIVQSNSGGDVRATFQDLETIARRDLTAELAKEAPDLQKIKDIIGIVGYGANITHDSTIIDRVNQIYDLQKLLMPNAVEYLSKAPDTHTQKVAELERQIESLQQQLAEKIAEAHRQGRELAETKQTLADAQAQNRTLNSENSALRQENANLGQSKNNSEAKLQQLIEGAKRMKSGIGSRGVKDYQQLVEEVNAGINR